MTIASLRHWFDSLRTPPPSLALEEAWGCFACGRLHEGTNQQRCHRCGSTHLFHPLSFYRNTHWQADQRAEQRAKTRAVFAAARAGQRHRLDTVALLTAREPQ
jgi:hypothetical protein